METTTSPSDTVCSVESPQMFSNEYGAFYDPSNSSEEELEVINGPTLRRDSQNAVSTDSVEQRNGTITPDQEELLNMKGGDDDNKMTENNYYETTSDNADQRTNQTSDVAVVRSNADAIRKPSVSLAPTTETRKRSLANVVDDEVFI